MGYSVTAAAQLEDKLHVAIKASAASLASLQPQITSLAQFLQARIRGPHNFQGGCKPDAASTLCPTAN
ncbi:hypothetical protein AAY473_033655 [Plecturocebus cupreus]